MPEFEVRPSHFLKPMLIAPWLERDPETARAAADAVNALDRGAWTEAATLVEYAQRRSPGDGTLTFALAEMSLLTGKLRAVDMFAFLAEKTAWGEAWRRLAICLARAGAHAAAASALHRVLARNAPPADPEFAAQATEIAGTRGWCGLDNAGFVMVSGGAAKFEVLLDGTPAPGRRSGSRGFQLAPGWHEAGRLAVRRAGQDLLGSPIDVRMVTRVEGFVHAAAGGIAGWCWYPGEPWRTPRISVNGREIVADLPVAERSDANPFAEPRGFALSAAQVAELGASVDVIGPHGRRLYGAPLAPQGEVTSAVAAARALARRFPVAGEAVAPFDETGAFISIQADLIGPKPSYPAPDLAQRRVLVVIPVYLGLEETLDCVACVLAAKTAVEDVLVVVDGSPDRELVTKLAELAASGEFQLDPRPANLGFPAACNAGLRAAAGRDVVLLNSDTLVPPGWIQDLRAAVYSAADIGTATPFSNAATIFSYPATEWSNPIPDLAATCAMAELAREANSGSAVEVPTAHGFCMYIRAECLNDTGLFREDVFGQGYGEENDFSLRARHLGWRHVAAAGSFVGHREGVSFGAAKKELTKRNLVTMNRLHPGYDELIKKWSKAEPLFAARRRMDLLRWRRDQTNREAVLIVSHDRGGGVLLRVNERVAQIDREGMRALVLRPEARGIAVSAGDEAAYPNLVFPAAPATELMEFLRGSQIAWAEIHHFLGYNPALIETLTCAYPVYDVILHDYAWYCPRITLTARDDRYCGEPDVRQCALCVADYGSNLEEDIVPADLHLRSLRLLRAAREIVAPSQDTARRYIRRFGIKVRNQAWQDESGRLQLRPLLKPPGAIRRIAVVGAISAQKGYDLLLQTARFVAARKLPLEFVVVGFTADDDRLLATGVVKITGPYEKSEAEAVIRAQEADFAFLPAQCPETWSYVLTEIWRAGLPVIALDIGAPAERIKARQGGVVVPTHMPVERLVGVLLEPGLFRAQG